MAPIPRIRPYSGPPLFGYGFRPFFLAGSLFASVAVAVWLLAYSGEIDIPTAFAPRDWHVHEMTFGFLPAIATGYLLSAIPNWTGRLPLQGRPLIGLFMFWLAGRIAIAVSVWLPWLLVAAVDLSFPAFVAIVTAREVFAGRNWRNLRLVSLFVALGLGDLAFHVEAHVFGVAEYGARLGVSAMTLLVAVVGGRLIPSFTRNYLARERPGRLPAPFAEFDGAAIVATALALGAWTLFPASGVAASLLLLAAAANAARLARWAGDRTLRDPLVFVMHAAYAFMPVGLTLLACAALGYVPISAGVHALTVGCLGLMTIAVMSRASLGLTGRRAVASPWVQVAYAAIVLAALARVAAAWEIGPPAALLWIAGTAWSVGFTLFAASYWRIFTGPSLSSGRPS